jgi:hypothetical protein
MDSVKEFETVEQFYAEMIGRSPKETIEMLKSRDQELAARHAEIGPCGRHPKMFTKTGHTHINGRAVSYSRFACSVCPPNEEIADYEICTLCQEVLAAEAAVIMKLRKLFDKEGLHGHYNLIQREFTDDARTAALDKLLEEARSEIINSFSDLAVEMEKHSNDHIHSLEETKRSQAAVEGVCADRIKAIVKRFRALPLTADTQGKPTGTSGQFSVPTDRRVDSSWTAQGKVEADGK